MRGFVRTEALGQNFRLLDLNWSFDLLRNPTRAKKSVTAKVNVNLVIRLIK